MGLPSEQRVALLLERPDLFLVCDTHGSLPLLEERTDFLGTSYESLGHACGIIRVRNLLHYSMRKILVVRQQCDSPLQAAEKHVVVVGG